MVRKESKKGKKRKNAWKIYGERGREIPGGGER
jgi:hypothetical protein